MQILQILLDDGKLILSEMPDKFVWRKMFPHLTKMCNRFGLKQKNVCSSCFEYVSWNFSEDEHPYYKEASLSMEKSFKSALASEPKLLAWYLFRYDEKTGFTLLRTPLK